MKIVFPEILNPVVAEAVARVRGIEAVGVEMGEDREESGLWESFPQSDNRLLAACEMVARGEAEAMVAGIDCTSRDVILACRDIIGARAKTFSAAFVMRRRRGEGEVREAGKGEAGEEFDGEEVYVVADAAACKNPTEEQLFDITVQTYETAKAVLAEEPRVAILSFSTKGSGGHDPSMEKAASVIERVRRERPEILIDGEMQLDAAISPEVGEKKAPGSEVAGRANVLIAPDLNSGNILYKAMERFGGFTAAGPILQGFRAPVSDLSRGSTVEDVVAVIEVIKKLGENHE